MIDLGSNKSLTHYMSVLPHIETSQLICRASQLTGFYTRATLVFNGLNPGIAANIDSSKIVTPQISSNRNGLLEHLFMLGKNKI